MCKHKSDLRQTTTTKWLNLGQHEYPSYNERETIRFFFYIIKHYQRKCLHYVTLSTAIVGDFSFFFFFFVMLNESYLIKIHPLLFANKSYWCRTRSVIPCAIEEYACLKTILATLTGLSGIPVGKAKRTSCWRSLPSPFWKFVRPI